MALASCRQRFVQPACLAMVLLAGVAAIASPSEAQQAVAGRQWAVVIGINKYLDPEIPSLEHSVDDARLVADTLVKSCGYEQKRILLIVDDQPQAHFRPLALNLRKQIGMWLKNPSASDTVLVYFAGHGFLDDRGHAFLAPQDCDRASLETTGFRTSDLRNMLASCSARQKILVLDCCHAGTTRSIESGSASSQELGNAFAQAEGLITLASCRKDEVSWEWRDKGQGLFTYFLSKGLAGAADFDRNGIVDSDEIYRYTMEEVPTTAQVQLNAKQSPVRIIGEDVLGVFPLARVKSVAPSEVQVDALAEIGRYASPDFFLAVVFRPSEMVHSPLMASFPAITDFLPKASTPEEQALCQLLQWQTIHRMTLFCDTATTVQLGVVFEFHADVDRRFQAALDVDRTVTPVDFTGRKYYRLQAKPEETPAVLYVAGPRTVLFAHEPVVQKMLTNLLVNGPLTQQLRRDASHAELAVGLWMDPVNAWIRKSGQTIEQVAKTTNMPPAVFTDLKNSTFAWNITADGSVRLRIETVTDQAAETLQTALNMGQPLWQAMIDPVKANATDPEGVEVWNTCLTELASLQWTRNGREILLSCQLPQTTVKLFVLLTKLARQNLPK